MSGHTSVEDEPADTNEPLKPPDSAKAGLGTESNDEKVTGKHHDQPELEVKVNGRGDEPGPDSPERDMETTFRIEEPNMGDADAQPHTVEEQNDEETARKRRRRKRRKNRFTLAPSNFFSSLFFLWVFKLVKRVRCAEDIRDVPLHLKSAETAKVTGDALQKTWTEELEQKKEKASLLHALYKAFGLRYFMLAIWKIVWGLFTWIGAYWLLKWLIMYSESLDDGNERDATWKGYVFATGLFLSSLASSLCFHQLTIQCTRIGVQCRAALMVLVYRKSLRLSYVKGGVGDIVNLISNECNRVAEAAVNWHFLWSAGLECLVIMILAVVDIGVAAAPAVFLILFILLPLQYFLARRASAISYKTTALITKRAHLMSEMLTAIKLIKFYAWEGPYREKVTAARKTEIDQMRRALLLKISNFTVVFLAPGLALLACLTTYYYSAAQHFSPSNVFTILSLFNTLRYPLLLLPSAVRTTSGAQTSLHRLEEFFTLPEIDASSASREPPADSTVCLTVSHADFIWDGDLDHPHISDLNLTLHRGELIAVIGDLGSGKSLLAAVMGQIKRTTGTIVSYGTCGYVPQEPWLLQNATLRDNILFGEDADEEKYHEAIRVSGLTRDFMLLSNGDESFVSELNLSQSQRQRISLARCLYHDPDIVLLEDCLSDFDQKGAKRIFRECVKNHMLKNKAVILVTQQKQFLPECDRVLVMKSGRVVDQGTYSELKANRVNFSQTTTDYTPIEDDPTGVLDKVNEIRLEPNPTAQSRFARPSYLKRQSPLAAEPRRPSPLATAEVITAEPEEPSPVGADADGDEANQLTIRQLMALNSNSAQTGALNEHTISKMIERNQLSILTGTPSRPPANFANQDMVTRTIEANQLTVHSVEEFDVAMITEPGIMSQSSQANHPLHAYVQYLKESTGGLIGGLVVGIFFVVHGFRFASDAWVAFIVDRRYSYSDGLYIGVYGIFCTAIAVGVLARGWVYSAVILRKSVSLHNRVLEAVLRAPMSFYDITPLGHILSNFARHLFLIDDFLPEATLQVLSFAPILLGTVILVAAIVPWFWATLPIYFALGYALVTHCVDTQAKFKHLEASNKSPMFAHLSTTLEGLFSIRLYHAQDRFDSFNRTLIDADHKALYSLMLVKTLMALYLDVISSIFIFVSALFVVAFEVPASIAGLAVSNALQLLLFVQWFVRTLGDVHAALGNVSAVIYFGEHVPREAAAIVPDNRPPSEWPSEGGIEFRNIVLRYHRYGIAVLKSVSFKILPGEKIGIVGRSGSGKTTLLVSLFRITEPSEGEILIDGVDISKIGLSDLRSKIAVIPQEPVMFTGTIRSNLDPSHTCSDEELWKALKAVHLGQKIEEMPMKLDTPVTENGKAFSLVERQLFSIARAIIIKTKIIIFDEPTISADDETVQLIQAVMRENFADCTILILATRFRSIIQADRIMVMESGRVVEFDTPIALLDKPRSKFSLMVSQTGDIDPARLRKLAVARAEAKKNAAAARGLKTENTQSESQTKHAGKGSIANGDISQDLPLSPMSRLQALKSSHLAQFSSAGAANAAAAMPKSLKAIFGDTESSSRDDVFIKPEVASKGETAGPPPPNRTLSGETLTDGSPSVPEISITVTSDTASASSSGLAGSERGAGSELSLIHSEARSREVSSVSGKTMSEEQE